jgi:hypothetical protein
MIAVEARNGAGLPSLKEGDVVAYRGRERLRVTGLTADVRLVTETPNAVLVYAKRMYVADGR